LKEQFEKIKSMIVKEDGKSNKKTIENLVIFLIILIITIMAINMIWKDNSKKSNKDDNINNSSKKLATDNVNKDLNNDDIKDSNIDNDNLSNNNISRLKENLEEILSKINGVGKVNILITYSESSQIMAMYNENTKETSTEEKDTSGGTRLIKESDTQKDVIYKEDDGIKEPITQKTIMPKIEGAIITAEGAADAITKTNIVQAVEAVTGLATHKIQVFEMST